MLQLGQRRFCRLTSSYVCTSCLAATTPTLQSSSILSRRVIVASRHVRLLSSTITRWGDATPYVPVAEANVLAWTSPGKTIGPKKRKRKRRVKESWDTSAIPPAANEPHETEAQRQLKVLRGAIEALKNVLNSQGVNVGPSPVTSPIKSPMTSPGPSMPVDPLPQDPARVARKAKKEALRLENLSQAGTVPEASNKQGKGSAVGPSVSVPAVVPAIAKAIKTDEAASSKSSVRIKYTPKARERMKSISQLRERMKMMSESREKSQFIPEPQSASAAKQMSIRKIVSERPPNIPLRREFQGSLAIPSVPSSWRTPSFLPLKANPLGIPFTGDVPPRRRIRKQLLTPPKPEPESVRPSELSLVPLDIKQPVVPALSYGLDRVLFNPGVYHLQDPRSRVFNFDPYLSEIMPVDEFDFNALKQYVTSSRDTNLIGIAKEHQKKYTGSTSSMTSMLAHFHFLLSGWRDINTSMLSRSFRPESLQYTRIMRAPAATFLHWKDGTYAIDADKEFDSANILSMLGKSMEKLLTLSKDEYERYRHGNSDQITEEERNAEEAFHYTGFGDFMMRSQLDAYDPRVPGTGMFDLKTRAVISIRMDAKGYQKGLGYEIRKRFGDWASFEREYYDMIRSAFLKYSLQVRMGRMDGIFVAFHNTQRIFGFQYISLSEMDLALHGTEDTRLGDEEFKVSLKLLNELLDRATKKWPEQSLRLHFETRASLGAPFMYFFAKPAKPEDIEAVQNAGKASVEAFERSILGIVKDDAEADVEQPTESPDFGEEIVDEVERSATEEMERSATWQKARQMVEEAMEDDERGLGLVREVIGDALEQSGILHARSSTESREYVDALLETITGRTQAGLSIIDPDEEYAVDENDAATTEHESENHDESLDSEVSPVPAEDGSRPGQSTSNLPNNQVHTSQITTTEEVVETITATSPANNPRNAKEDSDGAEDYEEESDIEAKEHGEDVGSSNLEPLKGIIMRMARGIDEQPVSNADSDSPQDDASKLKDFECILARLITQSKVEQRESGNDSADSVTTSESVPSDDVSSVKSKSTEANPAQDNQGEETPQPAVVEEPTKAFEGTHDAGLLCLTLTIKNKVNGNYVDRPRQLSQSDDWSIEYEIQEVPAPRAKNLYAQVKTRRRKTFSEGDRDYQWYKMFRGNLSKMTEEGRQYRKQEEQNFEGKPMYIVGNKGPLQWEDVFRRQPKVTGTSDGDNQNKEGISSGRTEDN